MSVKPIIYGFDKAGNKYESVHREEFEQSATLILQDIVDGKCYLEVGKEYRIYRASGNKTWGFTISFNALVDTVDITFITFTLPSYDQYKEYITFKVLSKGFDFSSSVISYSMTYEINGERKQYSNYQNSNAIFVNELGVCVKNADRVLMCNEGNVVLQPNTVFFKYSNDENGTSMSDTYNGQIYMGTYVGKEASTNPSNYTWVRIIGDLTATLEAALEGDY